MKKPKFKKVNPKDFKTLNTLNAGVYYPPDNQGRAQLRGGKKSRADKLTRFTQNDDERS